MCDYVSWIEKDGKLYWLTDDDVYSGYGRQQLRDVRDNDVLGHGAIRAYYGLVGGVDHERQDWWSSDLPYEIKKLVRSGACTRMLEAGLQSDDLHYIAKNAPVWALKLVAKTDRLRTRLEAGVRHTQIVYEHDLGGQRELSEYENGKCVLEESYYTSGQLEYRHRYNANDKCVLDEGWYENGQQAYRCQLVNGKIMLDESWYKDGQQTYRCQYDKNGKFVLIEAWYENGQQSYRYQYDKNGKIIQSEQWSSAGNRL